MAKWALDEKRYREEVFRAIDNRWDPKRNLFRCAQLPLDVSDAAVIEAAFKAVRSFVNRNSKTGTNAGPAKVLANLLPDAQRVLTDPEQRARHRGEVLNHRAEMETGLRAELGGMRAVPTAGVASLAAAWQMHFTRDDVLAALTAMGCSVREPVELPAHERPPPAWRSVQHEVTFLGLSTVREYLHARFGVVTAVTAKQLLDHRTAVQSTASGDVLTAEMSVVSNVQKWLASGQLVELLRSDLLRDLEAAAALGGEQLTRAIKEPGLDRYLAELGLPGSDEVAYALLCARKYPAVKADSWQTGYREARSRRDLRTARDVLVAHRSSLDKQLVAELDNLTTELAEIDARAAKARSLERTDVEAAAEEYTWIGQRIRDPEVDAALRRCHPSEPRSVTATVSGETVVVSWTPSTARVGDITYRVVRNAPGDRADGATLGTGLTALTVTDSATPAGVSVSYSVWTLRNDEPSRSSRTSPPVAVLRPVRGLELLPGERAIDVRWELPDGASAARDGSGRRSRRVRCWISSRPWTRTRSPCRGPSHREATWRCVCSPPPRRPLPDGSWERQPPGVSGAGRAPSARRGAAASGWRCLPTVGGTGCSR